MQRQKNVKRIILIQIKILKFKILFESAAILESAQALWLVTESRAMGTPKIWKAGTILFDIRFKELQTRVY